LRVVAFEFIRNEMRGTDFGEDDEGANGGGGGGGGCPVRLPSGGGGGGGDSSNAMAASIAVSTRKDNCNDTTQKPPSSSSSLLEELRRRGWLAAIGAGGGGSGSTSATTTSAASPPPSAATTTTTGNSGTGSVEADAKYSQVAEQPDQVFPLPTYRQVSSIPRSADFVDDANLLPKHQPACSNNNNDASNTNYWVYPSEQQLYNAMRRKGWNHVREHAVPAVLQIHNSVNERTWNLIRRYHCNDTNDGDGNGGNGDDHLLRLARFQGRPRDWSPKAFLLCKVLRLRPAPFDRHDWYVEYRSRGRALSSNSGGGGGGWIRQRYVIDYYYADEGDGNSASTAASMAAVPRVSIDARPALDHPRSAWLRGRHFLQLAFPGISSLFDGGSNNNNGSSGDIGDNSKIDAERHEYAPTMPDVVGDGENGPARYWNER